MNRVDTLALLNHHKPELQRKFGVVRLALFELDRESFSTDPMRYDAVLRNIELIGEAATHIPADVRAAARDARRVSERKCLLAQCARSGVDLYAQRLPSAEEVAQLPR